MPDQIVPTPVTATTPPVNTANDQSLDDILNDLEKQYNITPPSQEKTTTAPAVPATPVKPMEASVPTPPVAKPLTEPPKFEVKEHTISTEPKIDKVKPTMPPVMEKTEMVKPVSPVQDKGAGFEALEQTKNAMPNEFDAPPAVKPVEPPKTENVPPVAPPPKKGGVSNVAKILGGVVGVLMLVAGTFAVNKLVTQPQDLRQQASNFQCGYLGANCTCIPNGDCPDGWACNPDSCFGSTPTPDPDPGMGNCGTGGGGWCGADTRCTEYNSPCSPENRVDCGADGKETKCINGKWMATGACCAQQTPPPGTQCTDQGMCAVYDCPSGCVQYNDCCPDGTHNCSPNGSGGGTTACSKPECRDFVRFAPCSQATASACGQVDYVDANNQYCGVKGTQCSNGTNPCGGGGTNTASCTAKKAYLANGCTTTDCPSKTPLAADAYIRRGDIILYELVVTTTSGTAENPVITDTLDNNFSYIAGDPGCTRNANIVTCTKGSSLANGQTWSPKILVELTGRMGIGTTPPLPDNLPNSATFVSSNAGTNTCNINLKSTNSIICTSLTLNPESPEPSTSVTATCTSNPTAAFYRFRRTNEGGTFVEIAPTATNTFVFTSNASGNTIVQCSPCRTSDVSTCSPYEDVANLTGGAPGVCTKVIAPPPPVLACVGLTINPRLPKLGDNVTITCGDASDLGANRYEFGYTTAELAPDNPRRVWIDVQPAAAGSLISQPINISSSGTYSVRCRACKDAACTNWDIQ